MTLDAVLPLIEDDLGRSTLLRESLARFGGGLRTGWVVTPESQVAAITAAFAEEPLWQVVSEDDLVERRRPRRLWGRGRAPGGDWHFQQIVKLAACANSSATFCVTLDADVIALRDVDEAAVAPKGRAISQIEPPPQAHPEWYEGSAKILRMPRSRWHNAVTPAILSPRVCRDLIDYIEESKGRLSRDWAAHLMRNPPWSEYSLYNTYLEGTGEFDDYHVRVERPVIYGDAVWHPEDFATWRGGRIPDRPLFTLVQSTAGASPDEVRRRLADQSPGA